MKVTRALTILELLVVIAVIGVLATLVLLVGAKMTERAQRVQCSANLKNLYVGANLYLQQNGSWPQIRMQDSDTAEQDFARDWISALKPFGISEKTWICPTEQTALNNPDYTRAENVRVDYVATQFDDKPITPHKWPRMPWFSEMNNAHKNGNLIVFADGSVSDLMTIAAGASPIPTSSP